MRRFRAADRSPEEMLAESMHAESMDASVIPPGIPPLIGCDRSSTHPLDPAFGSQPQPQLRLLRLLRLLQRLGWEREGKGAIGDDLCVAGRDSIGVGFGATCAGSTYLLLHGHSVAIDRVTTCASSYRKAGVRTYSSGMGNIGNKTDDKWDWGEMGRREAGQWWRGRRRGRGRGRGRQMKERWRKRNSSFLFPPPCSWSLDVPSTDVEGCGVVV